MRTQTRLPAQGACKGRGCRLPASERPSAVAAEAAQETSPLERALPAIRLAASSPA